ncbi:MAG: hypothetical protein KZQ82_09025 [Candidatus Thiodiazotropha sp. (ex Lucinoma annulata)]|nr:hypothetical protein [Candidatus Thiodiazotropha sp. (ex Lucinoma annulata)]
MNSRIQVLLNMRHFIRFYRVLFLMSILLIGCSSEPLDPEQQLRTLITDGEAAIESRDLSAVLEMVDSRYLDKQQRDYHQLRALLAGYFLRHRSIHIISRIERIEIETGGVAQVTLYVGLAGSPQENAMPLSQWRGDLIRLQLHVVLSDDEAWLVSGADWRPAHPSDLVLPEG